MDRRIVRCACKIGLLPSIQRGHQCALEQIKASNCYLMKLPRYAAAFVVNEDAAHEFRCNKDKFIENVKRYALPCAEWHAALSSQNNLHENISKDLD